MGTPQGQHRYIRALTQPAMHNLNYDITLLPLQTQK
jgi:hypothetical protein